MEANHIWEKSKQIEEQSKILNVNLYQNEPQTDDTNSCNDNNNDDKNINGDMIAGRVDNAVDVKKNLTSLTSNDKIKYVFDLLENKHINKKDTTKYYDDDIVDMIDMIFSKLKEMNMILIILAMVKQ